MKRMRMPTGQGNGVAIIPDGQILAITMVPADVEMEVAPTGGSWIRIGTNDPIWVPVGTTLDLQAADIGLCCGEGVCDRYPGDVQIEIVFGQDAAPYGVLDTGGPPKSWLVVYNGC